MLLLLKLRLNHHLDQIETINGKMDYKNMINTNNYKLNRTYLPVDCLLHFHQKTHTDYHLLDQAERPPCQQRTNSLQ